MLGNADTVVTQHLALWRLCGGVGGEGGGFMDAILEKALFELR